MNGKDILVNIIHDNPSQALPQQNVLISIGQRSIGVRRKYKNRYCYSMNIDFKIQVKIKLKYINTCLVTQ